MERKVIALALFLFCIPVFAFAQSVELLWQGSGYVPPFYAGKTLWSAQTNVALFALPHGLGDATALNYKWTRNGTVLGSSSGVGKNSITYTDTVLSRTQTFKVDIISSAGKVITSDSITLTPSEQQLFIYENNPLLGYLFNRSISGTYIPRDQEFTFSAFPFFYTAQSRADANLAYKWSTNDGAVETKSSVTYRTPEGGTGTSQISVRVNSKNQILQDRVRGFLVQFGNGND
jgi:hypothetical protein